MIVNVRLYCTKHPKGQVFTTESDVEIALAQGWRHNKEEILAKPVPENTTKKVDPYCGDNLCACGCGQRTAKNRSKKGPKYKKYFSHSCYVKHIREKARGNG